jgi:hypothetical protein
MDLSQLLNRLRVLEEGSMKSAERKPTGPSFAKGKWKGTDSAADAKNKYVGGGCEESTSILVDLEKHLVENPVQRDLMAEYQQYIAEYGGTGGYGAASQAPQGTNASPDPAQKQAKLDQLQIQKSTSQLSAPLNSQGAATTINKAKFGDVMTKLDAKPNTQLSPTDQKELAPLAVAASKIIQNPQTASQFKQLVTKADSAEQQKQAKVDQAKQQAGTNQPMDKQTPTAAPGQPQPGQPQTSAGKVPQ